MKKDSELSIQNVTKDAEILAYRPRSPQIINKKEKIAKTNSELKVAKLKKAKYTKNPVKIKQATREWKNAENAYIMQKNQSQRQTIRHITTEQKTKLYDQKLQAAISIGKGAEPENNNKQKIQQLEERRDAIKSQAKEASAQIKNMRKPIKIAQNNLKAAEKAYDQAESSWLSTSNDFTDKIASANGELTTLKVNGSEQQIQEKIAALDQLIEESNQHDHSWASTVDILVEPIQMQEEQLATIQKKYKEEIEPQAKIIEEHQKQAEEIDDTINTIKEKQPNQKKVSFEDTDPLSYPPSMKEQKIPPPNLTADSPVSPGKHL